MNLPPKKLSSVLIKPSGPDCNLACNYCFYLEKSSLFGEGKSHRMSEELLEETIEQILSQSTESVAIAWQGGEPSLLGLNFFEKAVQFEKKYGNGKTIGNSFQTNGILIDEKWADFFLKNDFLVGLSLDGPEHIHDHHRKYKNNIGTWNKVIHTAKMLIERNVAVNTLSVVNSYSADYPVELYNYFKSIGINYMQFIPVVEKSKGNGGELAEFSVLPEQYGKFLNRIFELWTNDFTASGPSTFIRFFDSVFYNYVNLDPPECDLLPTCGNYLVIEHNGEVFSCDFFVEDKWTLGTIQNNKLIDLLNSPMQEKFGNEKSLLNEECSSCKWLNYCYGGCIKHRSFDPKHSGKNYFCESFKMFFETADSKFKDLANLWINQNQPYYSEARNISSDSNFLSSKIKRNDPCYCSSGKKYKNCCGVI